MTYIGVRVPPVLREFPWRWLSVLYGDNDSCSLKTEFLGLRVKLIGEASQRVC